MGELTETKSRVKDLVGDGVERTGEKVAELYGLFALVYELEATLVDIGGQ